ncbi:succinate dehydrogenase hydrophobic membrane anchor subunit [Streptomyces libani]|uniref:Succinate dehydrogenase n=3 Tax=Streptomyces TaxID=1883 RepID=A0A3Q9KCJ0_9ACTN|nr:MULTISPECIES: succinate dehydrogenase hydrophobic membrane anchor subunit [Streptomyces]AWN29131.1 succinate dehydrogenase [Streptomyces sp. NEAU-S7GS2]AZS73752.1 succinate dehydrogenase [Streptomyces lydicus]MCR8574849.1 succinate dehydrogenase hydrophobic membrane anchor subunit [Streptomyces sp. Isolate_219]MCX5444868.1 succinate dehydrogenase hydrophobic membrane anchor subunit [Streptomyces libani]MYT11822.1 succinate dehydrogenase [Streptomyces sp. SID4951]
MSAETTSAGAPAADNVTLYDVDNPAPVIEPPRKRTGKTPKSTRTNFELYGWLFMRLSGIVLVVLVLGHLLIQLVLDGGVSKIGFAFVAGRWASPFWQVWDLLMLWLAMLHGANGLRTVINDYAQRDNTRFWLKMLLYTATVFTVLLGTLVIFTFDPNIS